MIAFVPFIALLALGIGCSWLGCIVPFAAIAAAAAVDLRFRAGSALVVCVWAVSQAAGFGIHHYPRDPSTLAWGAAMLVAVLAAFAAARALRSRPILAFCAAFGAFEIVLAIFSVALGGWGAYAPYVLLGLLAVNAAWFLTAQIATAVFLRLPPLRGIV